MSTQDDDVHALADVIGTRSPMGTVWVALPSARTKVAEIILDSDWLAGVIAGAKAEERKRIADWIESDTRYDLNDDLETLLTSLRGDTP